VLSDNQQRSSTAETNDEVAAHCCKGADFTKKSCSHLVAGDNETVKAFDYDF